MHHHGGGESLPVTMNGACAPGAEQLLRGLAAGDESLLRSVLAVDRRRARPQRLPTEGALPPATRALVHLAALLAAGGSTTSLRWAVEFALQSGARVDEIVEVLVTTGAVVGTARIVAAAPRLALAIGYDVEVEDWDGD